jgi:hypothetical protein
LDARGGFLAVARYNPPMRCEKRAAVERGLMVCTAVLCIITPACRRPDLRVVLVNISGFTEAGSIWMPFRFALNIRNAGGGTVTIERIHITPDVEGFNEAYNLEHPGDLAKPIRLEPGRTTSYQTSLTLLNALQLSERTHKVTFKVRIGTSDGDHDFDFPAELEHSRDPKKRTLRRLPEL